MRACFSKMDEEVNGSSGGGSDGKRKTVGSTTVLVVMGKEEVVVANCGVSRVVLGRGGVAVPLSEDHKPYRLDERERVEAIGGWITNRYGSDCLGGLGTSRSIGHQHLKPYMICEPEVTVSKRTESDNFLIIVSDGLWDVVSNEVACDVVTKCFEEKLRKGFAEGKAAAEAASMLAGLALCKGSKDNISVIVVELSKAS
ncbi:probable protein phosphatase 2C 8 isoform X2 [Actinidia eriantha]|uniref:probable protein phosphatase 2C 8 isoform X2 n=1 Tax=Actinidia eriantha TaxID=165200 RepID=UPI002586F349|nr:probable protein phosphatase 2C 8 isoform X2 [Actinidia eriantha]